MKPRAEQSLLDPGTKRECDTLRDKLSRSMLRAVGDFDMIEKGDKILVAISGGKDSYTLFDLLWRARKRSPVPFDLIGFHLDQVQPGYDGKPLADWLEAYGAPYRIHSEDTYTFVTDQVRDTAKSYCAPCSRMRRGILYTKARELGCNKIALGHHREDTLETLLLNLFYSGKLQAMPAKYKTQDGEFDVIRPLIECDETMIARYAELSSFPILPCNLCGSQDGMKREQVGHLLSRLEEFHPDIRRVMLGALKNVRPSHLLDREVAEAWEAKKDQFDPRQ